MEPESLHPVGRCKTVGQWKSERMMRKRLSFRLEGMKALMHKNAILHVKHGIGVLTCKIEKNNKHVDAYQVLSKEEALICVCAKF